MLVINSIMGSEYQISRKLSTTQTNKPTQNL